MNGGLLLRDRKDAGEWVINSIGKNHILVRSEPKFTGEELESDATHRETIRGPVRTSFSRFPSEAVACAPTVGAPQKNE